MTALPVRGPVSETQRLKMLESVQAGGRSVHLRKQLATRTVTRVRSPILLLPLREHLRNIEGETRKNLAAIQHVRLRPNLHQPAISVGSNLAYLGVHDPHEPSQGLMEGSDVLQGWGATERALLAPVARPQ